MGIFGPSNGELLRRLEHLEDRVRRLTAEWEQAQLDLVEVSRRASNTIRSLARREAHQEAGHGPNGNGGGVMPGQPRDPVSAAILARRRGSGVLHKPSPGE